MTTTVSDNRDVALEIGYRATDWPYAITWDQYVEQLADWSVKLIERDGEGIGALYRRNGEVHVSILPQWRGKWATRGLIREILGNGATRTVVTKGHEFMLGVLKRLGLREVRPYEFEVNHGNC